MKQKPSAYLSIFTNATVQAGVRLIIYSGTSNDKNAGETLYP